jgi:hypothetical protein
MQFGASCVWWSLLAFAMHANILGGFKNQTFQIAGLSWDLDQFFVNRCLTLAVFTAKNSVSFFCEPHILLNISAPVRVLEAPGHLTWTLRDMAGFLLKCRWGKADRDATKAARLKVLNEQLPPMTRIREEADNLLSGGHKLPDGATQAWQPATQ